MELQLDLVVTKENVNFLAEAINKHAKNVQLTEEIELLVDQINDCSMILNADEEYYQEGE